MVSLRLIPRDERFLELFVEDGENLVKAAQELEAMVTGWDRLDERVARIRELEHHGDEIDNEVGERLERAFITPFDREDIHELASRLDDVVDGIQEIAETFVIYAIDVPTMESRRLVTILAHQAVELHAALSKLGRLKGIEPHLRQIHTLENEADRLFRDATAKLFHQPMDALHVLKWRDLYRAMEDCIDSAEDAGEVIERMLHKGG